MLGEIWGSREWLGEGLFVQAEKTVFDAQNLRGGAMMVHIHNPSATEVETGCLGLTDQTQASDSKNKVNSA